MEEDIEQCLQEKLKSSFDMKEFLEFEQRVSKITSLINDIKDGKMDALNDNQNKEVEEKSQRESKIMSTCVNKSSSTAIRPTLKRSNVINKTSSSKVNNANCNSNSMFQEAFKRMAEQDANQRHKERIERNKKTDDLKAAANKAFKDSQYEKALSLYNEAIEERRDSCLLYTNRALVHLKLGLWTKTCEDCESALKLRDSLKPRLYKTRALYEMGKIEDSESWLKETKQRFSDNLNVIAEYVVEWTKS